MRSILQRLWVMPLIFCLITTLLSSCSSSGQNSGGSEYIPFLLVFFSSNRLIPNNDNRDGDIFYMDLAYPTSIFNLTEETDVGDDEDYACVSDLGIGRNRLFFVSERTDIGNAGGDVDIFSVPNLGGTIVNLTDGGTGDRDDLCLGLTPSTGSVIFESVRTDQGSPDGDQDLYTANLVIDDFDNIEGAILEIKTQEKAGVDPVTDRLVWIGNSDVLYFESARQGFDDTPASENGPFENADGDQHIFSVPTFGAPVIRNLTHDGDVADAVGGLSEDVFCGLSDTETTLVFQSTRDQGVAADGSQVSGSDPDLAQDIFVRDLRTSQALTGGVNDAVANLSDAGSDVSGATPGDGPDYCNFGYGWNAWTRAGIEEKVLFSSSRTASGLHRTDGTGGFDTFSEVTNHPDQMDTGDIFSSNIVFMPVEGALNTLTNLTDGAAQDTVGDRLDHKVGVCGDTLVFASSRTDLAPESDGSEDDIFRVNIDSGEIVNLTEADGGSAGGDQNDAFLCCNSMNDRLLFASSRTDIDNENADVDIFSVSFSSPVITNMTDDGSGADQNDIFQSINFNLETGSPNGVHSDMGGPYGHTTKLVTGLDNVPSGALDSPGVVGQGYGYGVASKSFQFACTFSDQIIFMSKRENPGNSSADNMDLFVMPFQNGSGEPASVNEISNLTDTGNPNLEGSDGLTGVANWAIPDVFFQ